MTTRHWTLILFISGLLGCKKDPEIPKHCTVNFQIDSTRTFTIGQTWKLLGFQSGGSTLSDNPLCEKYEINEKINSDSEITISFADTLHNYADTTLYIYPYLFVGKATVNGYSGSYKSDNSNNLIIGPVVQTLLGGPRELMDYEKKYIDALRNAKRFVLQNNYLIIYYGQSGKLLFVSKK